MILGIAGLPMRRANAQELKMRDYSAGAKLQVPLMSNNADMKHNEVTAHQNQILHACYIACTNDHDEFPLGSCAVLDFPCELT